MIRALARLVSIGVLLAAGCGQDRVFGYSCGDEGCSQGPVAPWQVCMERELPTVTIPAAQQVSQVDRCVLFTLDRLTVPSKDASVLLTMIAAAGTPETLATLHDLDVRMTERLDEPDGEVACQPLLSQPIPWVPLTSATHGTGKTLLESAPLLASRTHRLLVFDSVNALSSPVETSVTLTLGCGNPPSDKVSRPFEMKPRAAPPLPPGGKLTASCVFPDGALLTRLFRRPQLGLEASFVVHKLGVSKEELWTSSPYAWSHELKEPEPFAPGEGLTWTCHLESAPIAEQPADVCSLFGIFHQFADDPNPVPEGCVAL